MERRDFCCFVAVSVCGLRAEEVVVLVLSAAWNDLASLMECQRSRCSFRRRASGGELQERAERWQCAASC